MAVAGSAVGLGNFLRFPGLAAQYGGGAFMLAYAISFLIIGLPIGWAEWAMGRYAGQMGYNSAPGAFACITRSRLGKFIGIIGVIVPVVIYMYYVFIESWCIGYAANFWSGNLHLKDASETVGYFAAFTGAGADAAAMSFSFDRALPWLLAAAVFTGPLLPTFAAAEPRQEWPVVLTVLSLTTMLPLWRRLGILRFKNVLAAVALVALAIPPLQALVGRHVQPGAAPLGEGASRFGWNGAHPLLHYVGLAALLLASLGWASVGWLRERRRRASSAAPQRGAITRKKH